MTTSVQNQLFEAPLPRGRVCRDAGAESPAGADLEPVGPWGDSGPEVTHLTARRKQV